MFYIFYIESKYNFQELKNIIVKILNKKPYGEIYIIEDTGCELEIVCDYFILSIDNNSESIKNTSEDYKIDLGYRFWIDMYTSQNDIVEKLMAFIGACISRIGGQSILLSNGDIPILIIQDKKIIVDDTNLNGEENFPFENLGIPFERGKIRILFK